VHEWQNTFVARPNGGRRGRRHPPIWKCSKCGTRLEDWQKPPDDLKLDVGDRKRGILKVTCDEYVAFQVMES
jgi:hypothetical protein